MRQGLVPTRAGAGWAGVCVAGVLALTSGSAAADPPRVRYPVPPGTHAEHATLHVSGHGFRATVSFYQKTWKRRRLPHRELPVYRHGDVAVARFLAVDPAIPWLAVHVFTGEGKTWIAFVPRPRTPAP
jgi:hypothetical protein